MGMKGIRGISQWEWKPCLHGPCVDVSRCCGINAEMEKIM